MFAQKVFAKEPSAKGKGAKFRQSRLRHELGMTMQEQLQMQHQQHAAMEQWTYCFQGGLHPMSTLWLTSAFHWPHTISYPTLVPSAAEFGTSSDHNVMDAIHAAMLPEDLVHAPAPMETNGVGDADDDDELFGTSSDGEVMKAVYAALLPAALAQELAATSQDLARACRPQPGAPGFSESAVASVLSPRLLAQTPVETRHAAGHCSSDRAKPTLAQTTLPKKVYPTTPPGNFAPAGCQSFVRPSLA